MFFRYWWEKKNYAFCSDFVRLWALYKYGGIYLDTDVICYQNIDERLLNLDLIIGLEYEDCNKFKSHSPLTNFIVGSKFYHLSNAIIGACSRNKIIREFIKINQQIMTFDNTFRTNLPTLEFAKYLKMNHNISIVNNIDEAFACTKNDIIPIFNAPGFDNYNNKTEQQDYSFCFHLWKHTWLKDTSTYT